MAGALILRPPLRATAAPSRSGLDPPPSLSGEGSSASAARLGRPRSGGRRTVAPPASSRSAPRCRRGHPAARLRLAHALCRASAAVEGAQPPAAAPPPLTSSLLPAVSLSNTRPKRVGYSYPRRYVSDFFGYGSKRIRGVSKAYPYPTSIVYAIRHPPDVSMYHRCYLSY